jgi:hypothetical protein
MAEAQTDEGRQHHLELRDRIQTLMAERGVSAEELTAASGVPDLIHSLTGERLFSSYELACIAEHFRVTTMYLITGEERHLFRILACNLDDVFPNGE